MSTNKTMRKVVEEAIEKFEKMTPEEFDAALKNAEKSELYRTLRYAIDPDWNGQEE